ncbi:CLUMA_CG004220, isoform A [Clunio marinus]|uniref:CLUMA_CG004220, isoform A n=1 Tax=Clunio marinus TaxID=568069 RepID=A0A1J1HQY6_9DIPT|nr:CLUMA_CG004220, isoform A [Clunio marinus]
MKWDEFRFNSKDYRNCRLFFHYSLGGMILPIHAYSVAQAEITLQCQSGFRLTKYQTINIEMTQFTTVSYRHRSNFQH